MRPAEAAAAAETEQNVVDDKLMMIYIYVIMTFIKQVVPTLLVMRMRQNQNLKRLTFSSASNEKKDISDIMDVSLKSMYSGETITYINNECMIKVDLCDYHREYFANRVQLNVVVDENDPCFGWTGDFASEIPANLHVTTTLNPKEYYYGKVTKVQLPNDKTVTVTLPPLHEDANLDTDDDCTIRTTHRVVTIPGLGFKAPSRYGRNNKRGDLFVFFELALPRLSAKHISEPSVQNAFDTAFIESIESIVNIERADRVSFERCR